VLSGFFFLAIGASVGKLLSPLPQQATVVGSVVSNLLYAFYKSREILFQKKNNILNKEIDDKQHFSTNRNISLKLRSLDGIF